MKALTKLIETVRARFVLAGSYNALREINELLGEPLTLRRVQSLEEGTEDQSLPVLEPEGAQNFSSSYGQVSAEAGAIAGRGIRLGVAACLSGDTAALVTAPSSKEALHLAGFHYPGQTEMIAALANVHNHIMILTAGRMRIGITTTHLALREVSSVLQSDLVWGKIIVFQEALATWFDIEDPRLAVSALNPHASDGGLFGDEEDRIILPAIEEARRSGVLVDGPFPADTLFPRWRAFDGILVMYHDQGMIPAKMVGFGRAVNMTGGLPFPRTSPDHGSAFDIAGKMVADPGSMIRAIKAALLFARRRKKQMRE